MTTNKNNPEVTIRLTVDMEEATAALNRLKDQLSEIAELANKAGVKLGDLSD